MQGIKPYRKEISLYFIISKPSIIATGTEKNGTNKRNSKGIFETIYRVLNNSEYR